MPWVKKVLRLHSFNIFCNAELLIIMIDLLENHSKLIKLHMNKWYLPLRK